MQDNENNLVDALVAVKNAPGFNVFMDYLRNNVTDWRGQLERPDLLEAGMIGFVRGQITAYKNLVNLFDNHLELIRQQAQNEAEQNKGQ